jgi:hypothetical protein
MIYILYNLIKIYFTLNNLNKIYHLTYPWTSKIYKFICWHDVDQIITIWRRNISNIYFSNLIENHYFTNEIS